MLLLLFVVVVNEVFPQTALLPWSSSELDIVAGVGSCFICVLLFCDARLDWRTGSGAQTRSQQGVLEGPVPAGCARVWEGKNGKRGVWSPSLKVVALLSVLAFVVAAAVVAVVALAVVAAAVVVIGHS